MTRTAAEVRASLACRHWEPRIIDNALRGDVAEDIIDGVVAPYGWKLCSAGWTGWDFEHSDGTLLQVKNAAAKQAWAPTEKGYTSPRFSISFKTGCWIDGTKWQKAEQPTRYANVYVFAWHPVTDATCDHCDPTQWRFYVVPTSRLPTSKTISLKDVEALSVVASTCDTLPAAVETARKERR
jgi:hypothetical protein